MRTIRPMLLLAGFAGMLICLATELVAVQLWGSAGIWAGIAVGWALALIAGLWIGFHG